MEFKNVSQIIKQNLGTDLSQAEAAKNWCYQNIGNIDLNDEKQRHMCETTKKYLIKYRYGHWTEEDVKFLIQYCVKEFSYSTKIEKPIEVVFPNEEEFKEKSSEKFAAVCKPLKNSYLLSFSPRSIGFTSNNKSNSCLDVLTVTYHELTHVAQKEIIKGKKLNINTPSLKTIYHLTLEDLAKKQDPKLYNQYYDQMLGENHANLMGLQFAIDVIKENDSKNYEKTIHNQSWVTKLIDKYKNGFYKANYDPEISLSEYVDYGTSCFLKEHPEYTKVYPALKFGYNEDGTKKTHAQLLEDRDNLLKENKFSKTEVDDLYQSIIKNRGILLGRHVAKESGIVAFVEYMKKNNATDDFCYEILKSELSKKLAPDVVEQTLQVIKSELLKNDFNDQEYSKGHQL